MPDDSGGGRPARLIVGVVIGVADQSRRVQDKGAGAGVQLVYALRQCRVRVRQESRLPNVQAVPGGERPRFQLSPPVLATIDPATGRPRKYSFGPWIFTAFGLLAKGKRLRGTVFDPFGYSAERRHERAAFGEYAAKIDRLLADLRPDNAALAIEIAALPLAIRGFGPVKAAAAVKVAAEEAALWAKWPGVVGEVRAAA